MHFQNHWLWKSLLENSLKSAVSEQATAVNKWQPHKCLENIHESALIMFFIILTEVDLENVSPSVRWHFKGVY